MSSGGFIHQLKEKLFAGEKHVDSEYETAYNQFSRLSDSLHKLKASATAYSNATYAVLFNSNSAAVELANILEDPLTENGYEVVSKQLLLAHQALGNDRQTALTQRIQEQVLQPLDSIILGYLELNGRVAKRNELHTNFEYYLAKVTELSKERDERGSKGKPESASQRDKHDRNQAKLDTARTEYQSFTQPLIADLHAAWNNRATGLGPILASFASIEKEFVQILGAQLDKVHPEQVGISGALGGVARTSITPQPAAGSTISSVSPATLAAGGSSSAAAAAAAPAPLSSTSSYTTQTVVTTTSAVTPGADVFGEVNGSNQTNMQQQQQQPGVIQQQSPPQQQQYSSLPDQQHQLQQQQSSNPFEEDVAAGSGGAPGGLHNTGGASLSDSLAAASALPPLEQPHDPLGAAQPQPNLHAPAYEAPKSEHEDESKRQRFEEEAKLQQQQQQNVIGI